jgi:hypothetical protein
VSVRAFEDDGVVRRDGVEIGDGRESLFRPVRLDPAAADDDGVRRRRAGAGFDGCRQLRERGDALQIEGEFAFADAAQVRVRVREAGKSRRAAQIDDLGARAPERFGARARRRGRSRRRASRWPARSALRDFPYGSARSRR